MNGHPALVSARVLIVEPDFLLRRTGIAVLREMGMGAVHEATSVTAAARLLTTSEFDGLLLALDDERTAVELLKTLRRGELPSAAAMPVAITAPACDASLALQLRTLDVRRLLLKPYRVRSLVETVVGLCAVREAVD